MKCHPIVACVMASLVVGGVALTTSRAAAEPIFGDESLSSPEPSLQKSGAADALNLFQLRDYEGSLKLWKELAKTNPEMPPAQVIMAQLFLQARMIQEAQRALEQAIADAPNDPEIYLLQANIALFEQNLDKASLLLRKAAGLMATLDKNAKRKEVVQQQIDLTMARIAEAGKDWAKAQELLEKCLLQSPTNTSIRSRLAFCLLQQKDMDASMKILREGNTADSTAPPPEVTMARFCFQTNNRKDAEHWLSEALTAAPKNLQTQLAAGHYALETGKLGEAQKHAIAATQIDPKSIEAKMFRALTALFQHDFATAESIYEGILKASPKNVAATNNLAMALIEQGDEAKSRRALELAEANAKLLPKQPAILSTYATVLYKLGRLDDAENAARGAESIAGTDGDTAYILARIAIDRSRKDDAKQLLEKVLSGGKSFMYQPDAEELLKQLKQ